MVTPILSFLLIFHLGIDAVWISTDSEIIAAEAVKAGAHVHRRAAYTATDDASSILGIREFVNAHPGEELKIDC